MPNSFISDLTRRWSMRALAASTAVAALAALPATAAAKHSQIAIIQDGSDLSNAPAAMAQFRALGATTVRVIVPWATIAPGPSSTKKPKFTATDPNAYSSNNWAPYDAIDRAAQADGLTVDFVVTGGAPRWAEGPGIPGGAHGFQYPRNKGAIFFAWKPNAADYGQFVKAVGTRYDGHFKPKGQSSALPDIHFWTIYNEPNFGQDLGPQATNDSTVATGPMMFRSLLNQGWKALHQTGHGRDTIIFGEFAAQGSEPSRNPRPSGLPGNGAQTRPLLFIRDLYCVNSSYQQLRGSAARAIGCPTSAGASRKFRGQNPALFSASAVSDHPYPQGSSPVSKAGNKADYATFPDLGNLASTFDRVNRAYRSGKKYAIYNTEYGYITNPPNRGSRGVRYVSPSTAATYINWAEYLSWRNSRIASYMQYLVQDGQPSKSNPFAGFASGLITAAGKPKPGFYSYRMPLWMPKTSFSKSTAAEVWGAARPAHFMSIDTKARQSVAVQLQANGKGAFKTVTTVRSNGYFDVHQRFASSGNVRLAYTFPKTNPFLPTGLAGTTIYSRTQSIKVR